MSGAAIQNMRRIRPPAVQVLRHPGAFALRVLKAFRANQGLLLAGAVAYYTLLSLVPLLILVVIALSHVIDQALLLETLRRALEWVVPGQSKAIADELAAFLAHRELLGWVLLATMLVFSSLAFTVLENAMSVIFLHRVVERKRHFIVSALLPLGYVVFIGVGLLAGTVMLTVVSADRYDRATFATMSALTRYWRPTRCTTSATRPRESASTCDRKA